MAKKGLGKGLGGLLGENPELLERPMKEEVEY